MFVIGYSVSRKNEHRRRTTVISREQQGILNPKILSLFIFIFILLFLIILQFLMNGIVLK